MNLPTLPQCHELFEQYQVPGTVREHCKTVHQIAAFLAQELLKQGYPLRLEIIKPFSLLHDFMKAVVLERLTDPPYNYKPSAEEVQMHQILRKQYAGKSETEVAYLLLKEKWPEFAALFLELDELTKNPRAPVREETKFVHYVDWRVMGNSIVPLKERMAYIWERYGRWIKQQNIDWEASKQEQREYEAKIFKLLQYKPEDLKQEFSRREEAGNGRQRLL